MLSIGVLKVVTFQVILAYNVHRSFILIYYGGIAETGQPWRSVKYWFLHNGHMTKNDYTHTV